MRLKEPLPALLAALLSAAPAFGHGADSDAPPIEVPPPPPGEGATALEITREVETKATSPADKKLVAEPLRRVKKALERAYGARTSGDVKHAKVLDGVALEWAETARDLLRATTAERLATSTMEQAREAAGKAERARALLEETQARRGRAESELQRLEAEAKSTSDAAAKAEEARIAAAKDKSNKDKKDAGAAGAAKPRGKGPKK